MKERLVRILVSFLQVAAAWLWLGKGQIVEAATIDVSSPIAAYYNLVYAVSVGQADAGIAQFTDDAIVVSGTKCTFDTTASARRRSRKGMSTTWSHARSMPQSRINVSMANA